VTLSVHLENRDGLGVGVLAEHPARVEVRTRRDGDGALHVSLWDHGDQIGSGQLHAERGRWRGVCTEWAGRWYVDGRCGEGTLVFSERAP
jgi:hypothetical protein